MKVVALAVHWLWFTRKAKAAKMFGIGRIPKSMSPPETPPVILGQSVDGKSVVYTNTVTMRQAPMRICRMGREVSQVTKGDGAASRYRNATDTRPGPLPLHQTAINLALAA